MELYTMLYQRLSGSQELADKLANYDGGPAVFYQRPPTPDDPAWGAVQYPRIDYTIDMQENPARNTSGILTANVWCDAQNGAEPESVEHVLRNLLHAAFAQTDDETYCFGWVRSDAFEIKNQDDLTARTYGVTVTFDIIACPCQYSMYPDPIKALNVWTKKVLPDAVIIGEDSINGWFVPTREQPAVYWRLSSQAIHQQQFTLTWLNVTAEGHVYARTAADRLHSLVKLNTAQALAGHIMMEDDSPMFIKGFSVNPHMNYLSQGQIQASGQFGILQPESHISIKRAGDRLVHPNITERS